jgi:hypothetical protein
MKNQTITLCRWLPAVVTLICTAGCATPALWKQTAAREWKPNPPDQVILVTDTNEQSDVVVVFRQFATWGSTGDSRDVGWCVSQSRREVALTKEAIGRLTNSACQRITVPMFFAEQEPRNAASLSAGYAVWHPMDQQLTVHATGVPAGPFTLPTSHQKRQTALRVCVLPVAVAADAALVGAALFAVGMRGYVGP